MIIHNLGHTTMSKDIKPGTLLIPSERDKTMYIALDKTMYIALVVVTTQELIRITWLSEELEIFETTYCL